MDVRDIQWQLFLFRRRLEGMQLALATSLAHAVSASPDAQFHAWNENLDLVVAVAKYGKLFHPCML